MKITAYHLTPNNDLQRSDCTLDDGTLCRRLVRGYEVDEATGEVKLMPPYATPQWQVFCPRDNRWDYAYARLIEELEREFVEGLIQANLKRTKLPTLNG